VTGSPEDAAVVEVARELVARTAPQELPLFPATSTAYLDDPDSVLQPKERGDDMLGFGVEAAVVLLTPAALEIAKSVVKFLAAQVRGALEQETGDAIAERIHTLLHPSAGGRGAAAPTRLTEEQLAQVHELALEKARALDLPEAKAGLLADAMVGSLAGA
jgi:hypothetical protein